MYDRKNMALIGATQAALLMLLICTRDTHSQQDHCPVVTVLMRTLPAVGYNLSFTTSAEHGFAQWRLNPSALVGFHPRLAEGSPIQYKPERIVVSKCANALTS